EIGSWTVSKPLLRLSSQASFSGSLCNYNSPQLHWLITWNGHSPHGVEWITSDFQSKCKFERSIQDNGSSFITAVTVAFRRILLLGLDNAIMELLWQLGTLLYMFYEDGK
ncbi:hypothetical protein CEXT_133741, partial [Caerostris extrusa]